MYQGYRGDGMKKFFLFGVILTMWTAAARGEHLGIYRDGLGDNCVFAHGFSTTVAIVLNNSSGTTGLRFRVEPPAGSTLFGFQTTFSTVGTVGNGLAVDFGQCLDTTSGPKPIGTIIAIWAPGEAWVRPAAGFANVLKTDCASAEYAISGCVAYVATVPSGCACATPLATAQSTWGQIKALYR